MKIAICGPGGCGKDTVAQLFVKHGGLKYEHSTSWTAAKYVLNEFTAIGIGYDTVQRCYDDRRNFRQFWASSIEKYNSIDKAALYRDHLKTGQEILTGIRKLEELNAVKAANLCCLYIWIDNPSVPVESDPTQEFGPGECDITIINDELALTEKRVKNFLMLTLHGIVHDHSIRHPNGAACPIRKG